MKPRVCDMRGMLVFLLLWILSKRPACGTELVEELAKRKGSKPSPGTIYPALKFMRDSELISGSRYGRMIVYTLTEKGKKELEDALAYFKKVFGDIFTSEIEEAD